MRICLSSFFQFHVQVLDLKPWLVLSEHAKGKAGRPARPFRQITMGVGSEPERRLGRRQSWRTSKPRGKTSANGSGAEFARSRACRGQQSPNPRQDAAQNRRRRPRCQTRWQGQRGGTKAPPPHRPAELGAEHLDGVQAQRARRQSDKVSGQAHSPSSTAGGTPKDSAPRQHDQRDAAQRGFFLATARRCTFSAAIGVFLSGLWRSPRPV